MRSCVRCGYTPKDPRKLFLSSWAESTDQWQCVDGAACKHRRDQAAKRAAK